MSSRANNPIERIADRASSSLRHRQALMVSLLAPFLAQRNIVELGCGSGLLAAHFIAAGAKTYIGYDISDVAINAAREQQSNSNGRASIAFENRPVSDLQSLPEDPVVVSAGLLDWLSEDELDHLFGWQGDAEYLHSISEKRPSIVQWAHRIYTHLSYGRANGGYSPRYYKCEEMMRRIQRGDAHVYRDRALSFGAFISSFPIDRADL